MKTMRVTASSLAVVLTGCLGGPGLDRNEEEYVMSVEGDATSEPDRAPGGTAAVLAEIVAGGGQITFLADPDGGVGVLEVTRGEPVVEELVERQDATPLEAFLALSTDDPPESLREDHRRAARDRGRASLEPRRLVLPAAGTVSLFHDCQRRSWGRWHLSNTGGYRERDSDFITTAGDIQYRGEISGSYMARRFDACGGDDLYSFVKVYIQSKASANAAWTNVLDAPLQITGYTRFYYTLNYGGRYRRMFLSQPASGSPRSFGVGGAWTPAVISGARDDSP